jgi:hypothetical protein
VDTCDRKNNVDYKHYKKYIKTMSYNQNVIEWE